MSKEPLNSLGAAYRNPSFPRKQPTVGTKPFLDRPPHLALAHLSSSLELLPEFPQSPSAISQSPGNAFPRGWHPQLLQNTFSFSCTIPHHPRFCLPRKELHFFHLQPMSHFLKTLLYVGSVAIVTENTHLN